jgi:hypothetical protein
LQKPGGLWRLLCQNGDIFAEQVVKGVVVLGDDGFKQWTIGSLPQDGVINRCDLGEETGVNLFQELGIGYGMMAIRRLLAIMEEKQSGQSDNQPDGQVFVKFLHRILLEMNGRSCRGISGARQPDIEEGGSASSLNRLPFSRYLGKELP